MAKGDATRDPNLKLTPVPSVLGGEVLRNTKVNNEAAIDPLASADTSSHIDEVSAAVLREFPDALSWEIGTVLYPNGYFYEGPLNVTLPHGGTAELEVEELGLDMADLTCEQEAGRYPLNHDLTDYKSGVRIPPITPVPADEGWRADFIERLREDHPGLLSVTLVTEEYDNGFFWSEFGSGVDAGGDDVDVDLSAFADQLSAAANEYGDLGPDSEETIDLVAPFDISELSFAELDELEALSNDSDKAIAAFKSVLNVLTPEQRTNFGFNANALESTSDAAVDAAGDIISGFAEWQRMEFGDLISEQLWADRCAAAKA